MIPGNAQVDLYIIFHDEIGIFINKWMENMRLQFLIADLIIHHGVNLICYMNKMCQ